jgi:hypothetical protein
MKPGQTVSQPQRENGDVHPKQSRRRQLARAVKRRGLRRRNEGGHRRRQINALRFQVTPLIYDDPMKAFHLGFVTLAVYHTDKIYELLPSYLDLSHFCIYISFLLCKSGRLP